MRRLALLLAGLVALAQTQALRAQETSAGATGIVVGVDGWWVAPHNAEVDYAFVDQSGSLSGGGELTTLEHDRVGVPRLVAGWQPSRTDLPAVVGRLWEYDDEATSSTGEHASQVGALLAAPDFAISRSLVDSAEAASHVRASSVEVLADWRLDLAPRSRLQLGAGVCWMRFERALAVTYRALRFGTQLEERVTWSSDAQGFGPLARVRFDHRVGRRVRLGTALALAVPVGDLESASRDAAFEDGALDRATEVRRSGTRRAFVQYDLAVLAEVHLGGGWFAEAAWETAWWSSVLLEQRFVDDVSQNTTLAREADVVFEGGRVGVVYRF